MHAFRQAMLIPVALAWMLSAGCAKKEAVLRPPQPQPATQTASRDTSTTDATTPPTQPAPTATAATTPKSDYPDKATRDRIDTLLARISDAYFDYANMTCGPTQ